MVFYFSNLYKRMFILVCVFHRFLVSMNFVPHLLWKESLMWEQSNQFLSKSMIITNQVNKKIKDVVSIFHNNSSEFWNSHDLNALYLARVNWGETNMMLITNYMINNVTFAHYWCFQETKKLIEWKYRRSDNHKVNYTKTAILAHEKYCW